MRTYKRKTNRAEWSSEDMEDAVNAVLDADITLTEASVLFNLPISTLRRKVIKTRECDDVKEACKKSL